VEDKAQLESDIVAALCAPPRHEPGEVPEEWVEYETWSLKGKEQEAAIYLGHVRTASGWRPGLTVNMENVRAQNSEYCWVITPTLQRAVKHNPELIVMAARMKKLMAE
jgi:hypothetical protein